jgi:SAM-dependent methyltransferase
MIEDRGGQRVRGRVFGEVAGEYDRLRPGYPAELVSDVLAYAHLDGGFALEVGAGTGKATVAFAERGVAVTAVEPDPAMAQVLTGRAGDLEVTVVVSTFEDFTPPRPYGLLYSAQAWHWTDPATRWQRAVATLAPGGALALFWNINRLADPAVVEAVVAAHQAHAPDVAVDTDPVDPDSLAVNWPRTDLDTVPQLGDLTEQLYRWDRTLSADDYVAHLATESAYRMLPDDVRADLFRAVGDALPGPVRLTVDTALYLARRARRAPAQPD